MEVVSAEFDSIRAAQSESIHALDTKAGMVLGVVATILAVLAAFQKSDMTWMATLAIMFFAGAGGLSVWALLPRDFHYSPKPSVLLNEYMLREPDTPTTGSREQILADKVNAYEQNEKVLAGKSDLVKWAAIGLGIGLVLICAHILWRKPMTTENPTPNPAPSAAPAPAPAPVAQPNPAAANTIKKGLDSRPVSK